MWRGLGSGCGRGRRALALILRSGQQHQRLPANAAAAHKNPWDVKAAIALGGSIHLEGDFHLLILVGNKIIGIEYDRARIFIGVLRFGVGAVQICDRHRNAANRSVPDTVQLNGELIIVDNHDGDISGFGIGQDAAACGHAGSSGVCGKQDCVGGNGRLSGAIHAGQHRMQPVREFLLRLIGTVNDMLAGFNQHHIREDEGHGRFAQLPDFVSSGVNLVGQLGDFIIKQHSIIGIGEIFGVLFDDRNILTEAFIQVSSFFLHLVGLLYPPVAVLYKPRLIAPGESGIGVRIVCAHFFKHCFSPGKHAHHVEQIPGCLVLKIVHEHLGIPGVIRFHAVVVFTGLGFKLQHPVVFSCGVERAFVDGICRNTIRGDLQARQ